MAKTRNKDILARWEAKKNEPPVTEEKPIATPDIPEPPDNKVLDALAAHVVDLSKLVETMATKKKVDIVATIQRDQDGKMSSILITEK